jgi:nitrogen fixation protein NifU and related proteins
MKFPYGDKVLEHFRNPHNVGKIENPDGKATVGSPACGDMVAVYLKVDPDEKIIDDIKFESYGCASNIATGSIITDLAKGKTIEEAKKLQWKDAADALGGLPNLKVHCSVLAINGLHMAINNYEEKHGLIKEKVPTTKDIVLKRLNWVMDPMTGMPVVRSELVKNVEVEDGVINIVVELPGDHPLANAIKEDIIEKTETLWGIKKVIVNFAE